MEDAYGDFISAAVAGPYQAPAGGGWTAEQIVAHLACTNEALIAATERLLAGDEVSYDNREVIDERMLDRYAASYGGLRGLADRVAETVAVLRDLAERLARRGDVQVPVRIEDGGEVALDGPQSWSELLRINATRHTRGHLDQLLALAVPES
jgi:hypothetical protein